MSDFAFGTYRITDTNPLHVEALKEALYGGIKLIDTSSNYTDGGAERAIAKALGSVEDAYRDVEIVSKFGYIQGSNMQLHKQTPFEDVVEYSPECFHSIAPSFMRDQLQRSLKRLEKNKLECYLLHNPEYFLDDALAKGMAKEEALDEMYGRIYKVFVALEQEVQSGNIESYGISSNAFSRNQDEDTFLPYEPLIHLAKNAAIEAKSDTCHFTTVQFPLNILEQNGLQCAQWAKENGLRVLINRPLNAFKDGKMYRLAEYEEPKEYYHAFNELLEISNNEQLDALHNLILQMDEHRHRFLWIGDYDIFVNTQIIPNIRKFIEHLQGEYLELLLQYIENFLTLYRDMVAYECGIKTKKELHGYFEECNAKIQECALRFLLQERDIDFILIGMRKPKYVAEILALKE